MSTMNKKKHTQFFNSTDIMKSKKKTHTQIVIQ